MTITVIVENDTIKLPVHLPDGTELEITLPSVTEGVDQSVYAAAREYFGMFEGPTDLSTNPAHLEDFGR